MKSGDRGPAVLAVQRALTSLGYSVGVSGLYDQPTADQVKKFQLDNRLDVTGQLDSPTQLKLTSLAVSKAKTRGEPSAFLGQERQSAFHASTSMEVIVVVKGESDGVCSDGLAALNHAFLDKRWFLTVVCPSSRVGSLESIYANAEFVPYDGLWAKGLNEAFRKCRKLNRGTTIYPIMACDRVQRELTSHVWPLMVESGRLFVVCDWIQQIDGNKVEARSDSPLWEQSPIGSVLFNVSLLPSVSMDTMPLLEHNADHATWLFWVFSGVKVHPLNWTICWIHRPRVQEMDWTVLRSSLYSPWKKPKVSALMVTGKNPERYPLARVAVDCFFNQTWSNKELVIINHGTERVLLSPDPRIKELLVTKGPHEALGDLRNFSIEAATGDWCMTWDDDDWHHPTRMENQMAHRRAGHLVTYIWQLRCAFTNNSAFYDKMPTGQQMSILFERNTPARYLSLEVREDTKFLEWFGDNVVKIDNSLDNIHCDPTQYIRFFHGRNIWNFDHVMKGSDGKNVPLENAMNVSPAHETLLARIMGQYLDDPKFSTSHQHPGVPVC